MPAIGIDFGTANCRVAVSLNGKVTVFENKSNKRETPSYVAFTKEKRIVGRQAEQHVVCDPSNTIFGIKRIIGRNCQDQILLNFAKARDLLFEDIENRSVIKMTEYSGERFYPEEIVAILLNRMKEIAEWRLGEPVTGAVITVPASFSETQRWAIRNSAKIVGIHVLELINETTAVAVAYANKLANDDLTNQKQERRTMIFHVGAGTTDVAVVRIKDHIVDVESSVAISNLGGNDFDEQIMEYWITKQEGFREESDKPTKAKLRMACREVKNILSSLKSGGKIEVDSPSRDHHYEEVITREIFENQNSHLIHIVLCVVHMAMAKANINESKIDDVVVVGGPTRLLMKLPQFSHEFGSFANKRNKTLNENEAAVTGAAIRAEYISGDHPMNRISVNDVVSERRFLGVNGADVTTQTEENTMTLDTYVQQLNTRCCKWRLYFELTISNSNGLKSDEVEKLAKKMEKYHQRDLAQQKFEHEVYALDCFAQNWKAVLLSCSESLSKCQETLTWISDQENKTLEDVLKRHEDLQVEATNILSQIYPLGKLKDSNKHEGPRTKKDQDSGVKSIVRQFDSKQQGENEEVNSRAVPSQDNSECGDNPNVIACQDGSGIKSEKTMHADQHKNTARVDGRTDKKESQLKQKKSERSGGSAKEASSQVGGKRQKSGDKKGNKK